MVRWETSSAADTNSTSSQNDTVAKMWCEALGMCGYDGDSWVTQMCGYDGDDWVTQMCGCDSNQPAT
eukprot:357068-Chlamydomonas_euryale.AAC.1